MQPSPYSLGCDIRALMVAADSLEALRQLDARGKVLLLHGALAAEPLMPKNFPFYNPENIASRCRAGGAWAGRHRGSHLPPSIHGWRAVSVSADRRWGFRHPLGLHPRRGGCGCGRMSATKSRSSAGPATRFPGCSVIGRRGGPSASDCRHGPSGCQAGHTRRNRQRRRNRGVTPAGRTLGGIPRPVECGDRGAQRRRLLRQPRGTTLPGTGCRVAGRRRCHQPGRRRLSPRRQRVLDLRMPAASANRVRHVFSPFPSLVEGEPGTRATTCSSR